MSEGWWWLVYRNETGVVGACFVRGDNWLQAAASAASLGLACAVEHNGMVDLDLSTPVQTNRLPGIPGSSIWLETDLVPSAIRILHDELLHDEHIRHDWERKWERGLE